MIGTKIEFFRHNIEKEDIEKVCEVLQSIFLTTGPVTHEFEEKFAQYLALPAAVGVSSCTAALHLSLLALGIGPGDEVITTPMTFVATANAILHTGARPVFADVEPETGLMDPDQIEKHITPKTKALLPVHLYGTMADMKRIAGIAEKYGLKVIEDCAHAIESEREGVRPGHQSDAACFSFYATKNLACGEGGAVAVRDPALAEKIRILRLHGMNKDAISRYTSKFRHWDMESLGWKYNMDSIHAALLVRQIERLPCYWERRKILFEMYQKHLKGVPGLSMPQIRGKSAYHLLTVWVNPEMRDRVIESLQDRGVAVAVNYRAVPELSYYRETLGFKVQDFPAAEKIGRSTLTLPLYPKLRDEELVYVAGCLREILVSLQ